MLIFYEIDEAEGVIRTRATGRLTDEDLMQHKRALLADPRYRSGTKELSDVRDVDSIEVTTEGIAKFARFDELHQAELEQHRLALLASSDVVFGLGRMCEMRTDGNTGGVQVFRDEGAAIRWLFSADATD